MNNNLRLIINNIKDKKLEEKHFFEKEELKIILDLYAKMVSQGSWKDYGLYISSNRLVLVYLKIALKMPCIEYVKISNLKTKILNI